MLPTVAVTRIPPVLIVFVPVRVSVNAPAVFKRRLLMVIPPSRVLVSVRSTSDVVR